MKTVSIWENCAEEFDQRIDRRTAVLIKENLWGLPFAYPGPFDGLNWFLDNRMVSTYDEDPAIVLRFAEFSFPDIAGKNPTRNSLVFNEMASFPGLVMRNFRFSNLGLRGKERFFQAPGGGFSWRISLECITHPCKSLDTILSLSLGGKDDGSCRVDEADSGLQVFSFSGRGDDDTVYLCGKFKGYRTAFRAEECGAFLKESGTAASEEEGNGGYLFLANHLILSGGESTTLSFGLSFESPGKAAAAFKAAEGDGETGLPRGIPVLESGWNSWFRSLPELPAASERDRKAYYKCWQVVRNNYYRHPRWGYTVLEALPVYRGFWQWALPAVQRHACENPEAGAAFAKKVLDMFMNHQRGDGYITHAIYIDEETPGERWSEKGIIQTPHIPWVALRYHGITGDTGSLRKWYPKLEAYYRYLDRTRDDEMKGLHLWGAVNSFDTGLDTNPVLQRCTYGEDGIMEDYCYPAILGAERIRYEEAMAVISRITGLADPAYWEKEADKSRRALDNYLWDETGWYGCLHQDDELDTRIGVDGLFPLAYGYTDQYKARAARKNFIRLLAQYGVHTFAPEQEGFCSDIYWRGPAWPTSCCLGLAAAMRWYPDLAERVKDSFISFILRHPSVWECMNPVTGEIARGDMGRKATPCVASNVGAGEALEALLCWYRGEIPLSFSEGYNHLQ
ncbi:MAG: MGH1-like glycoside hydrolase domain-containing protein [Spirochaetia bacterium]